MENSQRIKYFEPKLGKNELLGYKTPAIRPSYDTDWGIVKTLPNFTNTYIKET